MRIGGYGLIVVALAGGAALGLGLWGLSGSATWTLLTAEIHALQRAFHAELSAAMRAVKANETLAVWNLILASFLYGVFHAAGPGHGKFVISTYLATHESRLARGLGLTFASSLAQGLTAIVVVEVTLRLLGLGMRDARGSTASLETASYVLVALVGVALAGSAIWRMAQRHRRATVAGTCPEDGCAHSHGPAIADLEVTPTFRRSAAVVMSVGLRPCAGAVLVLLFAHILGLPAAGLAAVLAISLGTAITVSVLAILAVYARKTAIRLAALGNGGAGRAALAIDVVALLGGVLVAVLGFTLFSTSLQTIRHPLM